MSNNGAAHSATAMAENLRAALEAGDVNRVLHLLKMGAPIVVDAGGDGQTALHIAAASGNLDMVEALIQAGCDVGMQDFVSAEFSNVFFDPSNGCGRNTVYTV